MINSDFFMKFQKFQVGNLISTEDSVDKFSYQISTGLYILFIMIVSVKQYIFAPIQCWIPAEWTKSWEEYSENYCWIIDTYTANMTQGPPTNVTWRTETRISYYQWVPFVLALQCFLFYLPHFIWGLISHRAGNNLIKMVQYAVAAASDYRHLDDREKKIVSISEEILKMMEHCREDVTPHHAWTRVFPFSFFGKRSGSGTVMLYFVVKLAYLVNAVGQLFLMQKFLQMDTAFFGWTRLAELARGGERDISGTFPYVSWCDVRTRDVSNSHLHSFMCVLPVNMLNEKIYIFLWFWEIFLITICTISLIDRSITIAHGSSRRAFVKKFLRIQNNPDADDSKKMKLFIDSFLRQDGVFYLWMISFNGGDILASEVIQHVYKGYTECRNDMQTRILENGVQCSNV